MHHLLLPLLFVATLVGVGAYDIGAGLYREPPPAGTALHDGSFAAWLEDRTKTSSPAMRALRPWWNVAMLEAFDETPSQVVVGTNGWFFYAPGLGYGEHAGDERVFADAVGTTTWLRDRTVEWGASFRLCLMPAKWRLYGGELGMSVPAARRELYGKAVAALRARGVDVVDVLSLLEAQRARSPQRLVSHPWDTHLAPSAYEELIAAMAPQLAGVDSAVAQQRLAALPLRDVAPIGDLAKLLLFDRLGYGDRFRFADRYRDPPPTADRPDCEVIVLGDSFAEEHERLLPRLVGAALDRTVDARGVGSGYFDLPRMSMEYRQPAGLVVVFMTERHFALDH